MGMRVGSARPFSTSFSVPSPPATTIRSNPLSASAAKRPASPRARVARRSTTCPACKRTFPTLSAAAGAAPRPEIGFSMIITRTDHPPGPASLPPNR